MAGLEAGRYVSDHLTIIRSRPMKLFSSAHRIPRITATISLIAALLPAAAQTFPDKPVTMVVPFGPGGTTDIMARILAEEFAQALGTPVAVQNLAGAGGSIGMATVARAKPDGYTVSMTTVGPLVIQPARRDSTGYSPESFDYLCGTYDVPLLTLVRADSPFKDYAALVAFGKANPGRFNYGSSGVGTILHISGLQQWRFHGIDALHVPYKSTGDMIVPLKNGELTVFNETPPVALQHQLRPLMSLTDQRVPGFEKVPSARELGVPIRGSVWGGLVAPKGLPADVRSKLENACHRATETTIYKARAQAANSPLVWRNGPDFRRFAESESTKLKKIVIEAGLQER